MIDDRNETKRGMLWLGSATAATRIIDIGSSLVILALLTREDMGTAALVLSTGAVVEAASGMGIGTALVQAKNLTPNDEQSLFWMTTGIGLLLWLVLVAIAPFVAWTYSLPLLVPMVAATGLKHLLVGAAVVPQQLLNKHLRFREAGAVQTLSTLSESVVKIALAAAGFGPWALVLGNISRGIVLFTAVLMFSGFRPRLHFMWSEAKGYLDFGIRVAAAGFLYQSYRNADYFLVGRFLGVEVLGVYRVAFDLGMQPLEVILLLINRVSYPIYVKIAHDAQALKAAFLRSTRAMTLLGAPIVAFLFFATEDVLALVTHGRWGAAVPAVRILLWGALLRGAAHLFPQVYLAGGKPNYPFVDSAVSLVVLVGAFWLGLIFLPELGMLSVCWAWIAAYPGLLWMHLVLTRRIMPLGTIEYLRSLVPGVGGAVLMIGGMWAASSLGMTARSHLFSLIVLSAVSFGTYAAYLRLALNISLRDILPKKAVARET